ncbi:phytanoyl-CoA dioxygenase family protein [Paraflavitalea soli]|uniref:Phytanoyl-CoA dioxygenase family protein n=1 Tax=Paraflavitalea soli TaxID=2315862 RepID=A0A3B7MMU0_9BACT|nr:phytanoyl-CoA dioxygenase family protein [Paraflavitalea soli]AXY74246.1 phytanoyl-CoA dioxygenase family protein [Paraflavitalea soli]
MSVNITPAQIAFFEKEGYLIVPDLLSAEEVTYYRDLYEDFLENRIDVSRYRSDLGSHAGNGDTAKKERITQIMVPSRVVPELLSQPLHQKALVLAKQLMGSDMELDFDMLIDKAPFSNTPTPWHQDCAYWISMPDTRATSCWVALDEATRDNGCMWYVPGSHKLPVRTHFPAGKGGGALECAADEAEGIAIEIPPGAGIFHHGHTLHYSRGNSTDRRRRAFITNYRPAAMIAYEREHGYDHTGEREVRNEKA